MQVHRINENTIQVNIDADELKERGITMLDLLGNKSQIQNFFYQILSEVDNDHTFAKDDPVTFQVMPSSSGLELLISKVVANQDDNNTANDTQLKQLLNGLGDFEKKDDSRKTVLSNKSEEKISSNRRVYVLNNIDMVVGLADTLKVEGLASSLYTYLHQYYLDLAFLDDNYIEMKPEDAWAIANEFGNNISFKKFKKIKNNAKQLLEEDALGKLRRYFAKA